MNLIMCSQDLRARFHLELTSLLTVLTTGINDGALLIQRHQGLLSGCEGRLCVLSLRSLEIFVSLHAGCNRFPPWPQAAFVSPRHTTVGGFASLRIGGLGGFASPGYTAITKELSLRSQMRANANLIRLAFLQTKTSAHRAINRCARRACRDSCPRACGNSRCSRPQSQRACQAARTGTCF